MQFRTDWEIRNREVQWSGCVLPEFMCWKSKTQENGNRRQVSEKWLGHDVGALMNGISALTKGAPERSLAPSNMLRTQWEFCSPEKGPHQTMLAIWSQTSVSQNWGKQSSVVYQLPYLWHLVIEAWMDWSRAWLFHCFSKHEVQTDKLVVLWHL